MLLWIKALHIFSMIAWACGSFYLPRLFVYHRQTSLHDKTAYQRFCTMESRLFWVIMTPAAVVTITLGLILLYAFPMYLHTTWMPIKIICAALLCVHHLACYHYMMCFSHKKPPKTSLYFRFFNEVPTILYLIIIICAVVKPF